MQNVAMDEETRAGAFLEAPNWQGPSLHGPTVLSRDLRTSQKVSNDAPPAETRPERRPDKHPVGFARPVDPWCLME